MPGLLHSLFAKRRRELLAGLLLLVPVGFAAFVLVSHFRAESSFAEAQEALQRGDLRRASAALRTYLEARPGSAEGHFLAARTARRAGSADEASAHLREAERLGWSVEGIALERVLQRAQEGDLRDSEARLQGLAGQDQPEAALVLEALARGYMATTRIDRGLDAVERLLKREPDHPQAHMWKGWLLVQLKRWEAAAKAYRRALELGGGEEARRLLASALLIARQYPEAAEHYEALRRSRPGDVDVVLSLAEARRNLGQAAEAKRLLEAVLSRGEALKPHQRAMALAVRAQLALAEGDVAGAEPLLRQSLAVRPRQRAVLFALSGCLETLGKGEQAAAVRREWQRLDAADKELVATLEALSSRPDDPDLRFRAGVLCLELGNTPDGLRWLNSVLALDPGHTGARAALEELAKRPR